MGWETQEGLLLKGLRNVRRPVSRQALTTRHTGHFSHCPASGPSWPTRPSLDKNELKGQRGLQSYSLNICKEYRAWPWYRQEQEVAFLFRASGKNQLHPEKSIRVTLALKRSLVKKEVLLEVDSVETLLCVIQFLFSRYPGTSPPHLVSSMQLNSDQWNNVLNTYCLFQQ